MYLCVFLTHVLVGIFDLWQLSQKLDTYSDICLCQEERINKNISKKSTNQYIYILLFFFKLVNALFYILYITIFILLFCFT